jgi:hypothetical protein
MKVIRGITELIGAFSVFIGTLHMAGIIDRIWPMDMNMIAMPLILMDDAAEEEFGVFGEGPIFDPIVQQPDWLIIWLIVAVALVLASVTFLLIRKAWQQV